MADVNIRLFKQLIAFICKEALINKKKRRENAFREWYRRLRELRALFRSGIPILCLTATATLQTKKKISKTLCLANVKVIELNRDRPEIKYVVQKVSDEADKTFSWLLKV